MDGIACCSLLHIWKKKHNYFMIEHRQNLMGTALVQHFTFVIFFVNRLPLLIQYNATAQLLLV